MNKCLENLKNSIFPISSFYSIFYQWFYCIKDYSSDLFRVWFSVSERSTLDINRVRAMKLFSVWISGTLIANSSHVLLFSSRHAASSVHAFENPQIVSCRRFCDYFSLGVFLFCDENISVIVVTPNITIIINNNHGMKIHVCCNDRFILFLFPALL